MREWGRERRRSRSGLEPLARPGDSNQAGRGQSLVEMALAFPILMTILLGTIDIGQMFFDYVQLRQATTEGASYAARNPSDSVGVTTAVMNSGVPGGTAVSVSTSGSCGTLNGTGTVTVQASSVFTPYTTSFFFSTLGWSTVNLSSSTTMRCLT